MHRDPPNRTRYQAFGLRLVTDMTLPGAWNPPVEPVNEAVEIVLKSWVPDRLPDATLEWAAPIDGDRLALMLGANGCRLFTHATGRYLLSADGRRLQCAPADPSDPAWFRVLLDTVLLCTALARGREGLHAASVVLGGVSIAIAAPSGGGKSTLVAELMRRGHKLLADDISFLAFGGGAPVEVFPGPPVMTLAEAPPNDAEPLLRVGAETWFSARVSNANAPLRAIVYLDRRPGVTTSLHAVDNVAQRLLGSLLALPRTPARAVSRLDLASRLATSCAVVELRADVSTPPARLAQLVEREFVEA